MELEGSVLWSLKPATCPYPELHESSPDLHILFIEDPFIMLPSHVRRGLPGGLFCLGFPIRIVYETFLIL
jgi:hypothetical protein